MMLHIVTVLHEFLEAGELSDSASELDRNPGISGVEDQPWPWMLVISTRRLRVAWLGLLGAYLRSRVRWDPKTMGKRWNKSSRFGAISEIHQELSQGLVGTFMASFFGGLETPERDDSDGKAPGLGTLSATCVSGLPSFGGVICCPTCKLQLAFG